jgi:adenylyltransferase/sulfurtransferase
VSDILNGTDLIVDGLDSFRTRYIVNQYSVNHSIPYVFSSCISHQFHVALFSPKQTGCLECAMSGVTDRIEENCETLGASAIVTGLTGGFVANIVMNTILGLSTDSEGQLFTVDLRGPEFLSSKLRKRQSCPVCGTGQHAPSNVRAGTVVMLCGQGTANVLPDQKMNIDLSHYSRSLQDCDLLRLSSSAIVYRENDRIISLFGSGRVLVEGVRNEEDALAIARNIWKKSTPALAGVLSS